jgi:hypothetical protein
MGVMGVMGVIVPSLLGGFRRPKAAYLPSWDMFCLAVLESAGFVGFVGFGANNTAITEIQLCAVVWKLYTVYCRTRYCVFSSWSQLIVSA